MGAGLHGPFSFLKDPQGFVARIFQVELLPGEAVHGLHRSKIRIDRWASTPAIDQPSQANPN